MSRPAAARAEARGRVSIGRPGGEPIAPLVLVLLAALTTPTPAAGRDDFIGPADYADYLEALRTQNGQDAVSVTFGDLWTHEERYSKKPVRVEGRVQRRFRQPARGEFPPLTELWLADPAGNPLCVVFPTAGQGAGTPGQHVEFAGTFLRQIRYQGSDAERLAPLVVGPEPPRAQPEDGGPVGATLPDASMLDGLIAGFLALVAVSVLVLTHLRRRPARREPPGPPLEFLGPDDAAPGLPPAELPDRERGGSKP